MAQSGHWSSATAAGRRLRIWGQIVEGASHRSAPSGFAPIRLRLPRWTDQRRADRLCQAEENDCAVAAKAGGQGRLRHFLEAYLLRHIPELREVAARFEALLELADFPDGSVIDHTKVRVDASRERSLDAKGLGARKMLARIQDELGFLGFHLLIGSYGLSIEFDRRDRDGSFITEWVGPRRIDFITEWYRPRRRSGDTVKFREIVREMFGDEACDQFAAEDLDRDFDMRLRDDDTVRPPRTDAKARGGPAHRGEGA
jgi:hypothetical protein